MSHLQLQTKLFLRNSTWHQVRDGPFYFWGGGGGLGNFVLVRIFFFGLWAVQEFFLLLKVVQEFFFPSVFSIYHLSLKIGISCGMPLQVRIPDLSNRTKPNKKAIEPNRTPIVRLGSAIEQIRTPILLWVRFSNQLNKIEQNRTNPMRRSLIEGR